MCYLICVNYCDSNVFNLLFNVNNKYVVFKECDNFDIGFKLFIYLFILFMMFMFVICCILCNINIWW